MRQTHTIPPFCEGKPKILILGSFPSVKSRETGFFYGHKQNRFWRVVAAVFEDEKPQTLTEKKEFLKRTRIALWDVVESCDIEGSSDASVKNVTVNDIKGLLDKFPSVEKIFVNGKTAQKLYDKYILPTLGISAEALPSTSPANAAKTEAMLVSEWSKIRF